MSSPESIKGQGIGPPQENEFDFVVAEHPKYMPGSGPSLAPISILPAHDSSDTAVIENHFQHENLPRYIVTYSDTPQLRIAVAPNRVLNYVSARTLEEYEWKQSNVKRALDVKSKGKVYQDQKGVESRDVNEPKKGRKGRKRKHATREHLNEARVSETIAPPSSRPNPRKSIQEPFFFSPKRKTLASPFAQRGLVAAPDTESEEDEEVGLPTDIAIEGQLQNTMGPRSRSLSRLAMELSMSANSTPESLAAKRLKSPNYISHSRDTRSSSRQTLGSGSRAGSVGNEAKRQRRTIDQESVATLSSREARIAYDELEEVQIDKIKASSKKSRHFDQYSTLAKTREKRKPEPEPESEPEPAGDDDEDEQEYEVEAILGEEIRTVGNKNRPITYYEIKWVGWDETTAEPAYNVGEEAIAQYERKKQLGLIDTRISKHLRAEGGNDSDGTVDSSDKEGLFVGGSKNFRGRVASSSQPIRGEVIDDEDSDESNYE
ncbi:unnamed protein product [Diplocarpon coronariae]|uniref:Chromo domain-containing protein n=1 Tax=Diplocarpon coronariae TaxID=2795749 RepID=A0A218ZHM0_9HELO|nr:hypothetical protein B2J93_8999 [Marssonina coronariae]